MPNIKVQCCGLVLLGIVSFFYYPLPRLQVRTTKVFSRILPVSIVCVIADIVSVFAIHYSSVLPEFFVELTCKGYLMLLSLVVFGGFTYLLSDIYTDTKKFKQMIMPYSILYLIGLITMLALPVQYVSENDGSVVYSYGMCTTAAYIIFAFFFVLMFIHLWKGSCSLHQRRRFSAWLWLFSWGIAAFLQFVDKSQLIVSFAGCIGIMIVFLMIENPELNLDYASGFFHTSAMKQYMTELYGSNTPFYLVNTGFVNEYTEFYESLKDCLIFVGSGELFLIYSDKEACEKGVGIIAEKHEKQPVYVFDDSSIATSSRELMKLLKSAQRYYKPDQSSYIVHIDEDLKSKFEDLKQTQKLIKEALENDRVEAFLQPIYSLKTGSFNSAEALARIRNEDNEIILPWKFIPVAEEEGSIVILGKKMIEQVCRFMKENDTQSFGLEYIEINLSVVQGEDKQLAADVLSIIKSHGISPDKINLEITETASLKGKEQLLENMTVLRQHGIEFSLDDFGTGQSNLDYMSTMPVQLIKFDRTMTQGFFASEKTRYIMSAAVRMVHDMGMAVVVEGIETAEQLECMKELDVDYIQGYYFSKPLEQKDFIAFMQKHNA